MRAGGEREIQVFDCLMARENACARDLLLISRMVQAFLAVSWKSQRPWRLLSKAGLLVQLSWPSELRLEAPESLTVGALYLFTKLLKS